MSAYTTPHGEPWEIVGALAKAAWLEPRDAVECMQRLASLGYRVVPVEREP